MKMHDFLHRFYYVLILFYCVTANVVAQDFVIEDIRIEGLQRLTPGTIFNYLPLEVGDTYTDALSLEAVRALFKTGFFDDVRLERDGNVLVVIVKERPAIGSIEITGNKDIKTEDLLKSLKEIGFAEGRVFEQSQLEQLKRELTRQYFSRGKYGVKIKSTVTPLGNNRVSVAIEVAEGSAAKIKQINIVGNKAFKEKKLLKLFELTPPTLISFFTKTDQYSRQKLSADLESLRSFYLDNGYVNFNIDSTQVSITPDKSAIYITINIHEGVQYTVTGVKLVGDLIVPKEELFKLITVTKGSLFSRKDITDSSTRLTDRLGDEGYAFANVNSIPDIHEEDKTVEITFFVDPGQRVYVRRINFIGNTRTREEVLRREMRQHESGWIATPKVDRGKIRLQRLGYFKEVNVETPAVPGTSDQVDVNYTVEEKPFGNFTAGLGFSQTQGLTVQTSITQDNFLGSGKRIQFSFSNSDVNRIFAVGYNNPYYTVDGISRGFNFNFSDTDGSNANLTAFNNKVFSSGVNFGIPISESNAVFAGLRYERTEIDLDPRFRAFQTESFCIQNGGSIDGCKFNILRLTGAFSYNTLNKAIFPTRGMSHRISTEMAVPSFGDSVEFFKLSYNGQFVHPIYRGLIFSLKGNFGYGDGIAGTGDLPFFENFFAGGPNSVRGYEENTLGPLDNFNQPLGGNIKLTGSAQVIFPIPFIEKLASVRFSGFFDAGNVWCSGDTITNDPFLGPVKNCLGRDKFDIDTLRYSAGLSGIWLSPFGAISVSIAKPIGDEPGDQTQEFQFNFGSSF
ncbi:MAG: outer membrane protein assembly factor BamA [Gammaproteobacteria bacterium]